MIRETRLDQDFISFLNLLMRQTIAGHSRVTGLGIKIMGIYLRLRRRQHPLQSMGSSLITSNLIGKMLDGLIVSGFCKCHIRLALIHYN